jgi:DNA-3-methyladenine glycosylase II
MTKSEERDRAVPKRARPQKATVTAMRRPRMQVRVIETTSDIRAGTRALRTLCPVMKRVHDVVGDPPLRRRTPGFTGLAQVVVGQQLSIASAGAIWKRTVLAVDPFDAPTLLATDVGSLRGAGLSQGKVRTLRGVADAIMSGSLDLDTPLPDEDLRAALLAISGIGPWTADIYTLFCLGHADGFAAGDLALQVAVQRAFGLDGRPDARGLAEIAERWRPWRGVAARLLWQFYAHRDPLA